jgi:hypothetical protein
MVTEEAMGIDDGEYYKSWVEVVWNHTNSLSISI